MPGAGSFEVAAYAALMKYKEKVVGKPKLGVQVSKCQSWEANQSQGTAVNHLRDKVREMDLYARSPD